MSEKREVSVSSDSVGLVLGVLLFLMLVSHPDAGAKRTLMGALYCGIGGPSYCPKANPVPGVDFHTSQPINVNGRPSK